ncbi:Uncharacterised protein [Weeksella virosa]|nr:Uncharacterised protein [Weeksella virosa]VEH63170.1 Uncharacterised protein [Weeksella virosa]
MKPIIEYFQQILQDLQIGLWINDFYAHFFHQSTNPFIIDLIADFLQFILDPKHTKAGIFHVNPVYFLHNIQIQIRFCVRFKVKTTTVYFK